MANTTWKGLTDRLLRKSGLDAIASEAAFNNPSQGLMTRYQMAAREIVSIIHEKVSVDLPVNFARRQFTLPIDNVQGAIYPLDSGMSVESLTFDGFRNLSASPPGPGVIRNWTYEYFTARYPDISQISSGAPTHYIILPVARTAESPLYRVRFYPNPDRAYTIEYIAQLNPYPLTVATSPLLWPPEYEHVIVEMAQFNLEDLLGEGKALSLGQQAELAYRKMRQKATAPRAERKAVRMKTLFRGRATRGYYDSPNDNESYSPRPGIR